MQLLPNGAIVLMCGATGRGKTTALTTLACMARKLRFLGYRSTLKLKLHAHLHYEVSTLAADMSEIVDQLLCCFWTCFGAAGPLRMPQPGQSKQWKQGLDRHMRTTTLVERGGNPSWCGGSVHLHKPVRRVGCPYGDARADLSPVEFKAEASFEGGEDVAST